MKKNIAIIIVIIIVLLIGGLLVWNWIQSSNSGNTANSSSTTSSQNENQNSISNQTKGTMYFSLADAAADMKNVTSVAMTIDNIQVYEKTHGWVTVSQTPQTFNLLQLKAKAQVVLLAKASLPAGTYEQFKLHIAKVVITASGKAKEATMPSHDFTAVTNVILNAKTNSAAQFDVMADKSIRQADNGDYIFAPVVRFDSRSNANVTVDANNIISVTQGQTNATINLGMDINGQIKTDFMIDPNAKLNLNGGTINIDSTTNLLGQ